MRTDFGFRISDFGFRACVFAMAAVSLAACRQEMYDQPKYEPLEASAFFADGQSARHPVEGTVSRGMLRSDTRLYAGKEEGRLLTSFPLPVTRELLVRGRERYDIFCAPCHDRVGSGNGMVVQRGYRPPPSFHIERLREAPVGHHFDVITSGFGAMPDHAAQIPAEDRWAIVAYVRALQLSQGAKLTDVPAETRTRLLSGEAVPAPAPASASKESQGGGH